MSTSRWQNLPILDDARRLTLVTKARRIQSAMRGVQTAELEHLARSYGVTLRTLQRYLNGSYRCPGFPEGSCLTDVRGGGLCGFCRRSRAMA